LVLVLGGEQAFLVCVFVREQDGGRGERNNGPLLIAGVQEGVAIEATSALNVGESGIIVNKNNLREH
jgi:hypothetical protein